MSEGAFSGIRFAEPLAQKGLSLWNAYTNGYAELDVFAGFKSRVGQERLNSPYTGLDSDKSGMHVEANSSLLISVLKGRNVPVAMVELRLQECDGKIPFTQPAIDRLERFVAATLRKKEEFPVRPYLSNLCVAEAYRRKGLGLVLCQVCEDVAKTSWGYDEIYLHVVEDDDEDLAALKLYQDRLNYTRLAQERKFTPGWEGGASRIGYYKKNLVQK